jgi:hypothetical protein
MTRFLYLTLFLYFSISLSIYLSICLSNYLSICEMRQVCATSFKSEVDISKTKQFCKTSLRNNESSQLENKEILGDILKKSKLTTSKTKHFPTKMEHWQRSCCLRTIAVCDFSIPSKVLCLPLHVIRSAAPVTQNHLSKPGDLLLQHEAPLSKSAP